MKELIDKIEEIVSDYVLNAYDWKYNAKCWSLFKAIIANEDEKAILTENESEWIDTYVDMLESD